MKQLSLFSDISTEINEIKPKKTQTANEISPQQLRESPAYFESLIAEIGGLIDPKNQKIERDPNWESLGGSYWKTSEIGPQKTKVYRWRKSSKKQWLLSTASVVGGKCDCSKENDCMHLRAIKYIQQRAKRAIEMEESRQEEAKREAIRTSQEAERERILEHLRDNFFDAAREIGWEMRKKPFFDLPLEDLRIIEERICS